jgi:CRP-like cAMP-binding protein
MLPELPPYLPPRLRQEVTWVRLGRGEALFRNGEPVAHVYYIRTGEVLALRYMPDGSEAVMQRGRSGEYFAQSAVLVPRYTCDARATGPTEVARLPVDELHLALDNDAAFVRAYLGQLAADLRRQCSRVERLRLKRAGDRVLHYLMCEGSRLPEGVVLQDWARELGLEPETLYRTLAELEAKGWITRAQGSVMLSAGATPGSCNA